MNKLHEALSPYLLQHKDNPVNWYEWCAEAFTEARKKDRPILLSIGYAACHWCHVMAHESFEDPKTAEYLNEHFICIKVDREERPDIDNVYMQAVMQMTGHGGWPLNIFITPEKIPFFGGTYFPKKSQYGMISFLELLEKIVYAWEHQREEINQSKEAFSHVFQQEIAIRNVIAKCEKVHIEEQYNQLLNNMDKIHGGFLGAPKFPQIPLWSSVFILALQMKNEQLLNACYLTANKICQGGIYDHLGGGFFRYSTDEKWLVPHFEKMLYDNALIIGWLTELFAYNRDQLFKDRIYETIDWLKKEMQLKNGCFAASLDADSEGEEGKFYTWNWQELTALLGEDLPKIAPYYGLTPQGNWEGKIIFNCCLPMSDSLFQILPSLQEKLVLQRSFRIRPSQDDKILLDWNALLIAALCKSSMVFNEPEFLILAVKLYTELKHILRYKKKWSHAYRLGKRQLKPLLEDYANIIQALIALFCATGENDYLTEAEQYTREAITLFYNTNAACYHQTPMTENDLPFNPFPVNDNATPSGNGMMAVNLVQLHLLTGKSFYKNSFIEFIANLSPTLNAEYSPHFSMIITAIMWFDHGLKIEGNWQSVNAESIPLLPHYLLVQSNEKNWVCCDKDQCLEAKETLQELLEFLASRSRQH